MEFTFTPITPITGKEVENYEEAIAHLKVWIDSMFFHWQLQPNIALVTGAINIDRLKEALNGDRLGLESIEVGVIKDLPERYLEPEFGAIAILDKYLDPAERPTSAHVIVFHGLRSPQ